MMEKFEDYIKKDSSIKEDILPAIKKIGAGIKSGVQKIRDVLFSKGGWMYHALALQKKGKLPAGIKINRNAGPNVPPGFKPGSTEPAMESNVSFRDYISLNEVQVPLEHPNPNVANVDAAELKEHILRAYRTRDPLFIWGAPGIGKTDIVNQAAKELGIDCIEFILSMRDPVDFLGLPSVERTSPEEREKTGLFGRTIYNPPSEWPVAKVKLAGDNGPEDKGGILFFDEMNRANPSVLASSLTLLVSGKVGNYKLPSNWVIISAGNRKEEAPNVTEIEGALANRVDMVNYVPTLKGFEDWSAKREGGPVEKKILEFLNFKKDFFHSLDPDQQSAHGAAPWPSPRSWAKASKHIQAEKQLLGRELTEKEAFNIMKSKVGIAAANEFREYLDFSKTFSTEDIDKIIVAPDRVPLPPVDNAPATWAIINAVVYHLRDKKLTADNFSNVIKYAIRMKSPEYAMKFIQGVFHANPHLQKDPTAIDNFREFEAAYGEQLGHEVGEETKKKMAGKKK
jgi:hypothetical protein